MKRIYLDHNATTPVHPEVAAAMRPYLEELFGNPSSTHWFGQQARKAVEEARAKVAALINCEPEEIIFTSGGTESNNLAIKGTAFAGKEHGRHIITSAIEHPAVTEVCRYLEKNGFEVTWIPVDNYGMVDPEEVKKAIRPDTILISIMHANNETGTIQPVAEIGKFAGDIPFHTDAAQSAGKITIDVGEMGVDMLSLAGHKFYAPKGVGALYIRKGTALEKTLHGADHEFNLRPGTENVPEITGLGKACELALRDMELNGVNMRNSRDALYKILKEELNNIHLLGHPEKRLPNTLNIGFEGVEAEMILASVKEVAASAGAACHADKVEASQVLTAMNVPDHISMGAVRFSTGRTTTIEEAEEAGRLIAGTVKKLAGTSTRKALQEKDEYRLTEFTKGLGCACKVPPGELETILQNMPVFESASVLVDHRTSDDAAVYSISDKLAVIQTIDFLTPMVNDPYEFGMIAAANALSDIYAMGCDPLFALNIAGFPSNRMPMRVLEDILRGAFDKTSEAGIPVTGGHTIDDIEPKFGLVVTGLGDPSGIFRNSGAGPGDKLILTKPIGTGIISTAIKRETAPEDIVRKAVEVMSMLNRDSMHIARKYPVTSCTDVTGFGLMGHLLEITRASGVEATISLKAVPVIEGVPELIKLGAVPGGTKSNLAYGDGFFIFDSKIQENMQLLLSDAQTSGGLLFTLNDKDAGKCLEELHETGMSDARIIGEITGRGEGRITVSL